MMHPWCADGVDSLQIHRAAVNIVNKLSQIDGEKWSSSLGVGQGLTASHHKKTSLLQNVTQDLRHGLE